MARAASRGVQRAKWQDKRREAYDALFEAQMKVFELNHNNAQNEWYHRQADKVVAQYKCGIITGLDALKEVVLIEQRIDYR